MLLASSSNPVVVTRSHTRWVKSPVTSRVNYNSRWWQLKHFLFLPWKLGKMNPIVSIRLIITPLLLEIGFCFTPVTHWCSTINKGYFTPFITIGSGRIRIYIVSLLLGEKLCLAESLERDPYPPLWSLGWVVIFIGRRYWRHGMVTKTQ